MYASIRRYEGVTDATQAARRVRESFVPLINDIDGLVAYFCIDAGDGVMVSTSVFETQAAAEELDKRAAGWVKANLSDVLPHPPQITAGTVAAKAPAEMLAARRPQEEKPEAPRH